MALSGLQIQKLLPKTNCKECGSNTCLAFAMKLAAKKANLSECPYASEEAKAVLGADSEPPVKEITIGSEISSVIGAETVLYRHEKTFVHQTVIAVNIDDDDVEFTSKLATIRSYRLERVGEVLTVGAVAVTQKSDTARFAAAVKQAWDDTKLPVIMRGSADAVTAAAPALKGSNSIISGVCRDSVDTLRKIAEDNGLIMAITASGVDGIAEIAGSLKESGFDSLLIQFDAVTLAQSFQLNSIARRAALKGSVKQMGYPSFRFINTGNLLNDTVQAVGEISKYGGIVVLPTFNPAQLVSLMTLRLNIYTDPQKPIQVEPKIYAIGEPDRSSPVFVTTNFSLTYFLVSGEIENAGISAWLVIPEAEGFSVLTAWAAGKFSGAHIGKFIKESGLEDMVDTRAITIPGYVSQISGELEEALPGWRVLVGPQEASDLEAYIKTVLK